MSAKRHIDETADQLGALPGMRGLHHVGIAVPDLDVALSQWSLVLGSNACGDRDDCDDRDVPDALGGHVSLRAVLEDQGVEAASLVVGSQVVELIAPHGDSPSLRRFLSLRGSGLHHVAFEVDDVAAALAAATARGLRAIDTAPRPGLHGTPVAFLHPSAVGGALVELVESLHPHTPTERH